ncbi:MAG: TetR/AcrR family transcriptional regulator [Actinomycetota bacterium]
MSDDPRRLLPAAERLDSIERAAARAFGRTGYAQTSMADVAIEAGVTKVLVYRHVDSKGGLYRSILERVSTELRDAFTDALATDVADPATVAHLTTARRDPDGYRLLFQHAEREPEFAAYAGEIMALIVDVADMAFGDLVEPHLRTWTTEVSFRWLVQAVLTWLEHGEPAHDDEFVETTSSALGAFITQLTGVSPR